MPHAYRVLLVIGLGVGCVAMASAQDRTFEHTMELQAGSRLDLEADRGSGDQGDGCPVRSSRPSR